MSMDEDLERKRHMLYYNQLLQTDRREKLKGGKQQKKKNKLSFGQQKVDFKDYVYAPDNYEFIAYIVYFVAVPYIAGAFFLFLFIAGGDFDNFMLLNLNSFIIVWLIGYEIVAAFLLFWIFIMFLQYEKEDDYDPYGFG
ncbi:hypothetical protein [Sulfurimonas sp. C5]|uniref:hypothetical protein n=1 Tax=Sulfurimonas sp. C5 TaxID=3036947 RepID=UPI002454F656|nr:hypothetical protein [Sulfurimonas sp. C5]MDH4943681.1 hypothetical protein [Sulfurimonas sp. C5]